MVTSDNHVVLSDDFNSKLEIKPETTILELGYWYNKKLVLGNVERLRLNEYYDKKIKSNKLTHLWIGEHYPHKITKANISISIPNLEVLILDYVYDKPIEISDKLKTLVLGCQYNDFIKIPKTVKTLVVSKLRRYQYYIPEEIDVILYDNYQQYLDSCYYLFLR